MNGPVTVLAVRPAVDWLRVGDVYDSDYAVADRMKAIAEDQPSARIDVVVNVAPPFASTRPGPQLLTLCEGVVRWAATSWSLDADTLRYAPSDAAPDFPMVLLDEEGENESPRSAMMAAFQRASLAQELWSEGELYDDFVVPYAYHDLEGALDALCLLARIAADGDLAPYAFAALVEIDRRPYGLWFDAEGIQLRPVHAWVDDPDLRSFLRAALPPPGAPTGRRLDGATTVLVDPDAPLTTGPAAARTAAAYEMAFNAVSNGAVIQSIPVVTPEVVEALLRAAKSEANAGSHYEDLRVLLYELAVERLPTPERAAQTLVDALESESPDVRRKLYVALSKLDSEVAHRALVQGFKVERGAVRRAIALVLWRQRRAIEILVREELVPSWGKDEAWAKRIVRLIQEECVPVSRSWLDEAPPALVAALGGVPIED